MPYLLLDERVVEFPAVALGDEVRLHRVELRGEDGAHVEVKVHHLRLQEGYPFFLF